MSPSRPDKSWSSAEPNRTFETIGLAAWIPFAHIDNLLVFVLGLALNGEQIPASFLCGKFNGTVRQLPGLYTLAFRPDCCLDPGFDPAGLPLL